MTLFAVQQQQHHQALPKNDVRFCIHQLAARDELLLKSLIRLLSHRTRQRWLYCASGTVDVLVWGDRLVEGKPAPWLKAEILASQSAAPLVLCIGHAPLQGEAYFLYLPLHASDLEQRLNQIGQALLDHAKKPALRLVPAPAIEPALASGQLIAHGTYRLLRWPPTALMAAPQHRKLATLMSGKPQSLAVLQQRSGFTLAECENFLHELLRWQLLEVSTVAAVSPGSGPRLEAENLPQAGSPVHWKASLGLVARIRNRLGLPSTAPSAPSLPSAPPSS